jgi:hypothetical protein
MPAAHRIELPQGTRRRLELEKSAWEKLTAGMAQVLGTAQET